MSALPERSSAPPPTTPDAQETREWLDALSAVIASEGGERAHFLLEQLIDQARQAGIDLPFSANTAYVNTIPTDQEERSPRQHRDRGAPARLHALERDGDGGQGEPPRIRPTAATSAATSRASPRWRRCSAPASTTSGTPRRPTTAATCSTSRATRRPASMRAPTWKGASPRSSCCNFRQEVDGKGISSYPHPKLMPEFWQFPTVSMGLGPADGDLPGALPQVPARARHRRHREPQGLGVLRRRRDGRARVARRDRPGVAREARQPDLRHQLQPAAPRRPGARQRQDHPGARERVPRLGLERHQADLGQLLGSAPRARQGRHPAQGDDGHGRRRLPGDEGQRRRLRPQALLRPAIRSCSRWSRR